MWSTALPSPAAEVATLRKRRLSADVQSEIPPISRKAPLVISQVIHVGLPATDGGINTCRTACDRERFPPLPIPAFF